MANLASTFVCAELKCAMFLTGASAIEDLKKVPIIISGNSAHWLTLRGIDISMFAKRFFTK